MGLLCILQKYLTFVLQYCHYAAGLVGIGLSRLFAASGLEDAAIATSTDLANSMGLFLQKTNIIRDYLEDVNDSRHFWPKEVRHQVNGCQKLLISLMRSLNSHMPHVVIVDVLLVTKSGATATYDWKM